MTDSLIEKLAYIMCRRENARRMNLSLDEFFSETERTWRRHIPEATTLIDDLSREGLEIRKKETT